MCHCDVGEPWAQGKRIIIFCTYLSSPVWSTKHQKQQSKKRKTFPKTAEEKQVHSDLSAKLNAPSQCPK